MKKIKMRVAYCFAGLSILFTGQIFAQTNSISNLDEAKKEIANANETYFQAFVNNDAALFAKRYTDDCWIMPPNVPTFCGPDAAKNFFEKAYRQIGIRNGKLITVDVYGVSEDIVAEIGFWKLYDTNQVESDDGKFLVLWKKTSKGWKMWRETYNSSRSKK
jgi:ketosteroid isomerase-like protein